MNLFPLFYNLIILIPSAIFHEFMHGWAAERQGDPTAKYSGRLTLNPLAHIELGGTILLPLLLYVLSGGNFLFAYAKPVPYNPYLLRDTRWGPMWVALAGPLSNLFIASVFGLIVRLSIGQLSESLVIIFNSVVYMNVLLAVFNLVPIPPLDGSKVLFAVLPDNFVGLKNAFERYGFLFLMIFVFFLFGLIHPIVRYLVLFLSGIPVF